MTIVINDKTLERTAGGDTELAIWFKEYDNGDVYHGIDAMDTAGACTGSIFIAYGNRDVHVAQFGAVSDKIRIIARSVAISQKESSDRQAGNHDSWQLAGYVKHAGQWQSTEVIRIPDKYEMFSPKRGLFESSVLADKCVFIAGLGSGGSPIVAELAKLGIGNFIILDHDRLEVGNIVRHVGGLSSVGRLKVNLMKEYILDKNPCAHVITCDQKITWDNQDMVAGYIAKSDIVINGTDGHDAKLIVNQQCVKLNKPLIMAGVFRRAYGGQILSIKPGITPCYQCFLNAIPDIGGDTEISTEEQARAVAYSDREVHVEPGLANDIAPIIQMVVKLLIIYLLRGKQTTLEPLNEDLIAPWYLWLSRREPGTNYERLKPMGFDFGDMSIMRWYGLPMGKDPDCPCCGDFVGSLAAKENFEIKNEDRDFFAK